jgi:plasmid stabilization system protein ParE
MDFRVELSDQAQRDIAAIYDWLHVYLRLLSIEGDPTRG